MFNQNQNNQNGQNNQDDGWWERHKAELERYAEDVRLRAAGTSREEIAAQAKAEAERKAAEDKALLDNLMRQKFEELPEGQREIYNKYASQMDEELKIERAKNEIQLEEDSLNREVESIATQLQTMYKNPSFHRSEIAKMEEQLQAKISRLKQIAASKPRELPNYIVNSISANSNTRRRDGF